MYCLYANDEHNCHCPSLYNARWLLLRICEQKRTTNPSKWQLQPVGRCRETLSTKYGKMKLQHKNVSPVTNDQPGMYRYVESKMMLLYGRLLEPQSTRKRCARGITCKSVSHHFTLFHSVLNEYHDYPCGQLHCRLLEDELLPNDCHCLYGNV